MIPRDNLLKIINEMRENESKPLLDDLERHTTLREDLEMDSLALAELTVRIETIFGIDVFEDGIVTSIGEIEDKIAQRQ